MFYTIFPSTIRRRNLEVYNVSLWIRGIQDLLGQLKQAEEFEHDCTWRARLKQEGYDPLMEQWADIPTIFSLL